MINLTEEEANLFVENGYSKEQVGATVDHYRQQGLSDDKIQEKINQRISEWKQPISDVDNYSKNNTIKPVQQDINPLSNVELKTTAQRLDNPINALFQNLKSQYHSGFQKFQDGYQRIGRNIPKLGEWWFGSQNEADFLKTHNDMNTPTIEELEAQYDNGVINKEQFKQQLDIRTQLDNYKADRQYRNTRNKAVGKGFFEIGTAFVPLGGAKIAGAALAKGAGTLAKNKVLAKYGAEGIQKMGKKIEKRATKALAKKIRSNPLFNIGTHTATGIGEGAVFGGLDYGANKILGIENENNLNQNIRNYALLGGGLGLGLGAIGQGAKSLFKTKLAQDILEDTRNLINRSPKASDITVGLKNFLTSDKVFQNKVDNLSKMENLNNFLNMADFSTEELEILNKASQVDPIGYEKIFNALKYGKSEAKQGQVLNKTQNQQVNKVINKQKPIDEIEGQTINSQKPKEINKQYQKTNIDTNKPIIKNKIKSNVEKIKNIKIPTVIKEIPYENVGNKKIIRLEPGKAEGADSLYKKSYDDIDLTNKLNNEKEIMGEGLNKVNEGEIKEVDNEILENSLNKDERVLQETKYSSSSPEFVYFYNRYIKHSERGKNKLLREEIAKIRRIKGDEGVSRFYDDFKNQIEKDAEFNRAKEIGDKITDQTGSLDVQKLNTIVKNNNIAIKNKKNQNIATLEEKRQAHKNLKKILPSNTKSNNEDISSALYKVFRGCNNNVDLLNKKYSELYSQVQNSPQIGNIKQEMFNTLNAEALKFSQKSGINIKTQTPVKEDSIKANRILDKIKEAIKDDDKSTLDDLLKNNKYLLKNTIKDQKSLNILQEANNYRATKVEDKIVALALENKKDEAQELLNKSAKLLENKYKNFDIKEMYAFENGKRVNKNDTWNKTTSNVDEKYSQWKKRKLELENIIKTGNSEIKVEKKISQENNKKNSYKEVETNDKELREKNVLSKSDKTIKSEENILNVQNKKDIKNYFKTENEKRVYRELVKFSKQDEKDLIDLGIITERQAKNRIKQNTISRNSSGYYFVNPKANPKSTIDINKDYNEAQKKKQGIFGKKTLDGISKKGNAKLFTEANIKKHINVNRTKTISNFVYDNFAEPIINDKVKDGYIAVKKPILNALILKNYSKEWYKTLMAGEKAIDKVFKDKAHNIGWKDLSSRAGNADTQIPKSVFDKLTDESGETIEEWWNRYSKNVRYGRIKGVLKYANAINDILLNGFKRRVLTSSSFFVNNRIGNQIMIAMNSNNPVEYLKSFNAFKFKNNDLPTEIIQNSLLEAVQDINIRKKYTGNNQIDNAINLFNGHLIETKYLKGLQKTAAQSTNVVIGLPNKTFNKISQAVMNFNQKFEDFERKQIFSQIVDKKRKELIKSTAQKMIKDSEVIKHIKNNSEIQALVIKEIEDTLGDYKNFSKAEQKILKRIIPFYSWYRTITRHTIKLAKEKPERFSLLMLELENIKDKQDDKKEYQKLAIKTGITDTRSGKELMINKEHAIPYQTYREDIGTNPYYKTVKEAILGRKDFLNQEITNDRYIKVGYKWNSKKKRYDNAYFDIKKQEFVKNKDGSTKIDEDSKFGALPLNPRFGYVGKTILSNTIAPYLNNGLINGEQISGIFANKRNKAKNQMITFDKNFDASFGGYNDGDIVGFNAKKNKPITRFAGNNYSRNAKIANYFGIGLQNKGELSKREIKELQEKIKKRKVKYKKK